MANSTPDTPDVSETKLAALKMDELRAHARKLGIDGADELHKPELLAKVKDYHYAQAHGGKHRDGSGAGSSTDGRPSASELSSMKLGELREHARKHGIDGADELHKPELLAKVKDHHAADSQPSATELSTMKLGELREHARKHGIDGADELHKPELLAKVKDYHYAQAHGGKDRDGSGSGSPTTSHRSASELSSMKLGELREHARKLGIDGADELHKPELLAKVKDHHDTNSGDRGATAAKTNRGGNSTPDTPEVSETKLAALKMDELRSHARKLGIDGADELHKPELLAKVKDHHYAQAHGGKHRPDSGSGSTGGAGGPSPVKEDRGGHSTPDTQEASKTALGTASTDTPQDRPSSPALPSPALPSPALPSPALHSSEVDEADEPAQPELHATVADAPNPTEDEHLFPLKEKRPDLDHTAATTQAVTKTAETAETPNRDRRRGPRHRRIHERRAHPPTGAPRRWHRGPRVRPGPVARAGRERAPAGDRAGVDRGGRRRPRADHRVDSRSGRRRPGDLREAAREGTARGDAPRRAVSSGPHSCAKGPQPSRHENPHRTAR